MFCSFGLNLVILACMCDKLWCGQAQNRVYLDFKVTLDLQGQGNLPHKTIGILNKVFFFTSKPNFGILTWRDDEFWHGWALGWHTHTRIPRQTQATTVCGGPNWPWVKMRTFSFFLRQLWIRHWYWCRCCVQLRPQILEFLSIVLCPLPDFNGKLAKNVKIFLNVVINWTMLLSTYTNVWIIFVTKYLSINWNCTGFSPHHCLHGKSNNHQPFPSLPPPNHHQ